MGGLLEVGRIVKAHGLRGQVVVELWTNRAERMSPGSVVTCGGRDLRVAASSQSAPSGGRTRWLVAFDGVDDRGEAEALRGSVLSAEPIEDPEALWVHDLVGAEVVDADGAVVGTVEAVEANPASDILVLGSGALIPLTFVTRAEPGRVTVEPPPGLLEL